MARPRKYEKKNSRIKTISLNEKASLVLENIRLTRKDFDFSRFVSESVINELSDEMKIIKHEIKLINNEMNKLRNKAEYLSERYRILQDKKISEIEVENGR